MGLAYPKTLFQVADKPILGHILEATRGLVDETVIVVSEAGKESIEQYIRSDGWARVCTAIQAVPIGMADAVRVGLTAFGSDNLCDYLIIWGDQVTVRRETLEQVMAHHRAAGAWLTFPTSRRKSPYIHIVRDEQGAVRGVLEAREGDTMPPDGESDCGVFLLRGQVLEQGLANLKARTWDPLAQRFCRLDGRPSATGEFNFLPLISLWAMEGASVEALPIATVYETQGVNTPDEVMYVEHILRERL
jgi:bifunctional UDP-N-acetylglucosamine pyrophosphorylase/glucosamine-1-phosphate N-acetyltransferase